MHIPIILHICIVVRVFFSILFILQYVMSLEAGVMDPDQTENVCSVTCNFVKVYLFMKIYLVQCVL